MRLFAALPLPPAAVERLTKLRLRLSAPGDGLRWSLPEQWHVTLQFFGDSSAAMATCLAEALAQLRTVAPPMTLESFGAFPAKGILHVQVEPSPALLDVHRAVLEASAGCGICAETRPFRPHITVARSKGKIGDRNLRRLLQPALPAFGPPLRWRAEELLLMESTLRPEGSLYSVRERFALQTPAEIS
jgi:RNA 2',3'-cyclic 3'-phosphodiesterase